MQANEFDSSDEDCPVTLLNMMILSALPYTTTLLATVNCSFKCFYSIQLTSSYFILGCKFKDVRRNLQKDIEELKRYETQDIFVLCTRGELSKYRVPNLLNSYQQHGITVHHHPIPDGDTPDIANCCTILEELRGCLENNCYGGLGRSCLIAACLLLQLSDAMEPQEAIESLRDLRGSGAIQTIKQYNYLHDFRENLAAHLSTKDAILRSVSR
uniref:Cyclin-dependent kinase inhibitor 3 n=1 Tax=Chelonoidis abingdonii TaxID=106734 RepID=A0A8C0HDV4_CHEAB